MSDDPRQKIENTISEPKNLGEMENADAVGTAGSADCGDMLRMWIKFREEGGKKVIDRATFQTPEEAMAMDGEMLSAPLGPLPPMRIHCAQLVEGALRQALSGRPMPKTALHAPANAPTLMDSFAPAQNNATKPVRVILKPKAE